MGIYKSHWPVRRGHMIACLSARMPPVACAATPCAPHVLLHVLIACAATSHGSLDDQKSISMSCLHARRHTVPTCRSACFGCMHGNFSCSDMSNHMSCFSDMSCSGIHSAF
ncbi:hypothetical protein F2Q68_00044549 [Brassica cretica]|uniref:Uncharacterized protein n=1 Tax=Brassica cretica TaxID=69181 RepID=A0A8S9LRB0_BRACR|nr:hypothetical protein F2Q68_00044549 [Brassica cretica]